MSNEIYYIRSVGQFFQKLLAFVQEVWYVDNVSKDAVEQTGNTKEGDVTVAYTNTKQVTTPGGVIMTIAPYALMVVLAGAFAVVFLTRRNRAE